MNEDYDHTVPQELKETDNLDNAELVVVGAPWLQAGLIALSRLIRHENDGDRNPIERVIQEGKRRTSQCKICFPNTDSEPIES